MNLAAPPVRPNVANPEGDAYRLIGVESVKTPEGCTGVNWFVYRITQGVNAISGFRRGNRESVRGEAETIVVALNERRESKKPKLSATDRRKAAAVARAAATEPT